MKKTILLFAVFASWVIIGSAQFPQIKWYYDTHDSSFGQSAAGDIDHDGKLEIVFGCYRNDSCIHALNAEDGSLLWKYNTHPNGAEGCNDVAPVIYDVDGDDSLEVIVPSSCNARTFCFRGSSGAVKWQTATAGSDSPPTIGDIDNDSQMEILHGGFDGHVLCLNALTGASKWSLTVDNNSWVQTAPTIVDLDGDGDLDFVVATWSNDTSRVYAYQGSNHGLLWKHSLADVVYHGTAVSDLDGDSKPELVIGSYDGKVYCLNGEDGSTRWIYTYSTATFYYVGAPATIADLNNDNHCEVVFVNLNIVGALTDTGSLIWHYTIPNYGSAFRGAAVADINGDNMLDVVFGTSGGHVVALNGYNGSQIWDLDLEAQYGDTLEIDHAPLITDFDDNDTIDVFIQGGQTKYPNWHDNYGRAYMFTAGIGNGPPWLMFQNDIRRQSSLCAGSNTGVPEKVNSKSLSCSVYPNPASYLLFYDLQDINQGREIRIEIYNSMGLRTSVLLLSGSKKYSMDISGYSEGIYYTRVTEDNDEIACEKIIVIR